MSTISIEEKLREASCIGNTEAVLALLTQNIDINSKNQVNGWTALHWATKRNNEDIVRILLNHGADTQIETNKGETAVNLSTNPTITNLLLVGQNGGGEVPISSGGGGVPLTVGGGGNETMTDSNDLRFVPNYLKNPSINGQVDIGRLRPKHSGGFPLMPTTSLPSTSTLNQTDELVLNIRIANSSDPDFIEIEIPFNKLTYLNLLRICCAEFDLNETQIERLRKLPNTRLRKDSDVKRLRQFQSIEIVLKSTLNNLLDKTNNCYQSISTCKNQTILY